MSEAPDLSHMSFSALRLAAYVEAGNFQYPPDWYVGRNRATVTSLDERNTIDVDDALAATLEADSSGVLRFSVADTGSFMHLLPDTTAFVERQKVPVYDAFRESWPLLPSSLSRDRFSLLPNRDRPATTFHIPFDEGGNPGRLTRGSITRDIVRTTAFSPGDVEQVLTSSELERPTHLHLLGNIALRFYQARPKVSSNLPVLETPYGQVLGNGANTSKMIVDESGYAAKIAVGRFLYETGIPALYSQFDYPAELEQWFDFDNLSRNDRLGFASATYRTEPGRHLWLQPDGELYPAAPVTSPLRDLRHLMVMANIAAYLDNRAYIYDQDKLREINVVLEATESQKAHKPYTYHGVVIVQFMKQLANHTLQPKDFAELFFGIADGTPREKYLARIEALKYLNSKQKIGFATIKEAVTGGLLSFSAIGGRNIIRTTDGMDIVDRDLKNQGASNNDIAIDILAQRIGSGIDVATLSRQTAIESRTSPLRDQLGRLSERHGITVSEQRHVEDDGSGISHTISGQVAGQLVSIKETGDDALAVQERAVQGFIRAADRLLTLTMDDEALARIREEVTRIRTLVLVAENQERHPMVMLTKYAAKQKLTLKFTPLDVPQQPKQSPRHGVRATLLDGETEIDSFERIGPSKEDAKLLAAEAFVELLGLEVPRRQPRAT